MNMLVSFFIITFNSFQLPDSTARSINQNVRITPIYLITDYNQSEFLHFKTIIYPDYKTTVSLISEDSSKIFVLFDNILDTEQNLIFTHQDSIESAKRKYINYLVIPIPRLDPGFYYFIYRYRDVIHKQKFYYAK